jgi:CheY-like chemotaxis protein
VLHLLRHKRVELMKKQILIIADDNEAMRWMVKSACRALFDEIIEARDGRELFWELMRHASDAESDVVVVTDVRMPSYSGLDVIAAYEELGYHPPTVVITSYPEDDVRARAAAAGTQLLAKPFTLAALRRVVDDVRS